MLLAAEEPRDERLDQGDRLVDGRPDGLAQRRPACRPRRRAVAGSQPTSSSRSTRPPIAAASRSTFTGSMPCASTSGRRPRPGRVVHGRLEHVERAGRPAARGGVDQDDRLVAVEQGIGQVEAPDAEIDDADRLRAARRADRRRATSTPKASSPRKMLPTPATRSARPRHDRLRQGDEVERQLQLVLQPDRPAEGGHRLIR